MKQLKNKIIPGDVSRRFRWIMVAALYLLLIIWFEPMLDFLLGQMAFELSAEGVAALNEKKLILAAWGFGLLRSLPLLLFLWLGWQVMRSKQLPPPGLSFPFSIYLISGKTAQYIGMGMIAVALLLLLRELGMLATIFIK